MTAPLDGKVAVLTGSTRNLGLATAHRLAELGADVVINYHSADRAAEAAEAEKAIATHGRRVLAVQADVTQAEGAAALFDRAVEAFGRVDILVNNAGLVVKKPIAETTEEDFDRAFAVNAKAPFLTVREAARRIEDGGRIVNVITSIVAFTIPYYGVYAGSKGAVEHLTKAVAKELGARGITANCVAPGPLNTSFYYPVETDESIAGAKSRSVGNRLGEIHDVVPLIAFLCLPEQEWITAQTIRVNGGMA
ncbi:SDR family oxidoreductase [Kribbella jejuensis]|uniref:NAD(P)-dependent dehydrogenase (Short-subunit alcohol dehydrogenase family) n=1 Tax=Kribbella jejuensis TaxID=236068 RepID=A0A542DT68_9ACTN|nr:SDR family oxidoreductase [Kribbella jejuensis]TQJ06293.1 NAD(P)-dependent dehydrogenase (short-subunit alcohol dehydrogenase family) [Kribbella jejuensis]